MINLTDILAVITCILAIIAIIVSISTWSKTNENTKRIAEKTLNTKFFEEIYFKYIIIELPSALSKINNNEGKLSESCEIADRIIFTILERSRFYKYFDEEFYNSIMEILVELDEKLIDMSEKNMNVYILDKSKKEIASLIDKFYGNLRKYYSGI